MPPSILRKIGGRLKFVSKNIIPAIFCLETKQVPHRKARTRRLRLAAFFLAASGAVLKNRANNR
jgi:hypothetical protein